MSSQKAYMPPVGYIPFYPVYKPFANYKGKIIKPKYDNPLIHIEGYGKRNPLLDLYIGNVKYNYK